MGKLFGIRLDQKAGFAYYPKDHVVSGKKWRFLKGLCGKKSSLRGEPGGKEAHPAAGVRLPEC